MGESGRRAGEGDVDDSSAVARRSHLVKPRYFIEKIGCKIRGGVVRAGSPDTGGTGAEQQAHAAGEGGGRAMGSEGERKKAEELQG